MANKIEFLILADTKELESKFKGLNQSFDKMGKFGAIAFAGLTATAFTLIDAYREEEQAINQLNQALKNQGNFTAAISKDLQDYASQMQKTSLFADDQIIQAQALIAQYGFEAETIKDVTKATLDLAQAKGMDLASAAELVAKAIGTDVNALARMGIEVEGVAGSVERAQSFIRNSARLFEGQAEAATAGYGSIIQLKNSLADLGDEIAKALQPTVESFTKKFISFVGFLQSNPEFAKLAAEMIVLGAQISIVSVGFSLLSKTFIATTVAAATLSTQLKFLTSVQLLGLHTSIGVLIANVGVLYPALVLIGTAGATAFIGWKLGELIRDLPIVKGFLDDIGARLGEFDARKKLGEDFISEDDFNMKREQEHWAQRAEARQKDIEAEIQTEEISKTLQEEKLERMISFQEQISTIADSELIKNLDRLKQDSDLTKTLEEQKTKILQEEFKKRSVLRDADKTNQLAALNFLSETVRAFGNESKATFFILKAVRAAEIIVNSMAASMAIHAVWAWNPPVDASLQAKNKILTAISLGTVLATTIAGFAQGTDRIPRDMTARVHKEEMIIPASFSEAIRSGDLSLSGPNGGGGSGITIDLRGAQINGITDKLVEEIFTKASENLQNRTLAFRGV